MRLLIQGILIFQKAYAPVLERQQERDVERKSVAALRSMVSMDAPITRGFHSTARSQSLSQSVMMSSQTSNLSSSLTSTIVAPPTPDRTTQVCESNDHHIRKSTDYCCSESEASMTTPVHASCNNLNDTSLDWESESLPNRPRT